jgi:hypothetical protein
MATVTSIADALATVIDAGTNADYISIDSFLPGAQTTSFAVIIVPFAQEFIGSFDTFSGGAMLAQHRITIEVWTRYKPDDAAATMDTARDAAVDVIKAVFGADDAGYTLARGQEVTARTDEAFREIATGMVYLVTKIGVWVEDVLAI